MDADPKLNPILFCSSYIAVEQRPSERTAVEEPSVAKAHLGPLPCVPIFQQDTLRYPIRLDEVKLSLARYTLSVGIRDLETLIARSIDRFEQVNQSKQEKCNGAPNGD